MCLFPPIATLYATDTHPFRYARFLVSRYVPASKAWLQRLQDVLRLLNYIRTAAKCQLNLHIVRRSGRSGAALLQDDNHKARPQAAGCLPPPRNDGFQSGSVRSATSSPRDICPRGCSRSGGGSGQRVPGRERWYGCPLWRRCPSRPGGGPCPSAR